MATQTITLGQKGSGHSSITLRVTYNPVKNGFYVTQYEGYRTGARSWSDYDATLNLILNGAYYPVTCRPDAQNGWWVAFWYGNLWVNQTGGYLEFTVSGGDSGQWKQSYFQYDLPGYSVYLRLRTMDCYGNYGNTTLWQSWSTLGGYSGSETAYANNAIYNSATWSSSGVWGNVDQTLSCSRKKYNFGITCKNELDENIPYTMEFCDTADGTFREVSEAPYSTQYAERPYKIKNIQAKGYELVSVRYAGNTLTPVDGVYSFTQPTNNNDGYLYLTFVKTKTNVNIKTDGIWKTGTPYIKQNGNWIEPEVVYIKKDGVWLESNS